MKKVKGKVKKVEGSDYGSVPVEGLEQHRAGSEGGKNRPNPKAIGQPNIVSKDLKPYRNQKTLKNPKWGDISVELHSDDVALKKFTDENS